MMELITVIFIVLCICLPLTLIAWADSDECALDVAGYDCKGKDCPGHDPDSVADAKLAKAFRNY